MSSLSSSMIFCVVSAMAVLLGVFKRDAPSGARVNRRLPEPRIQSVEQTASVSRGVGFVVVVEVDVDVAAAAAPGADEGGPLVELRVVVAPRVELARAVQSHVRQVAG